MRFQATVTIALKPGVLDPQGAAVKRALASLGYGRVSDVRVGKHIVLELEAESQVDAESQAREMAWRVLANPVLETFHASVAPVTLKSGEAV
ncbi:MAG: phosphoribosylformylglycinamidine synthase subunit PurS [Bacillota bacterium]